MDLQLPGLTGLTSPGRFKSDPDTAEIKVVALTANAMKGARGGAAGWLRRVHHQADRREAGLSETSPSS